MSVTAIVSGNTLRLCLEQGATVAVPTATEVVATTTTATVIDTLKGFASENPITATVIGGLAVLGTIATCESVYSAFKAKSDQKASK